MAYGTQFWVLFFSAASIVFILPTAIGIVRRVDNLALVIVLNVFALVSLGVGWLGALLFACTPRRAPRRPLVPPEVEHMSAWDPDLEYIMEIAATADRLHQQ